MSRITAYTEVKARREKILQGAPKKFQVYQIFTVYDDVCGQTNVSEHFPNISKHFGRLPRITEDDRKRSEDVVITHQLSVIKATEKCHQK